MNSRSIFCYSLLMSAWALASATQAEELDASTTLLDRVIVTATREVPTSLPSQIPTTMEGVTAKQIDATVNATDSEDALKYFPSLLVRKRYIGDYNHAVLSSRASGTGNSARSAVYADGILLSNYLGNGATYAPRWMLVTPEEVERVDVMYGPFSATYPGNSVGAVVDYVTRMPNKFEAHVKASYVLQPFELYNTDETFHAHQESASVGDRTGNWSWWLNFNHTNSHGQPLTFTTKSLVPAPAIAQAGDRVITGAVTGKDRSNIPWFILGTGTEYTTLQDHAKLKLAYDFSASLRLSYLLGYWRNDAQNRARSYLTDTSGSALYSGNNVNINGYRFNIAATDFGLSNEAMTHVMHGLSLKSNTNGSWDWEVSASLYDYAKDQMRTAGVALPAANSGGAGTLTDQHGTGWTNLALKGTWRPQNHHQHIIDFGYQLDHYTLRILRSNLENWIRGASTSIVSDVSGNSQLQSIYAQDSWALTQQWRTVLGVRVEQSRADDGYTYNPVVAPAAQRYADRNQMYVSPKAALAYQAADDTVLKFSLGRAVRMPTVSELYGATTGVNAQFFNDPNLKPEKSWTSELSMEQALGSSLLRATAFYEVVDDSLFSDRRLNSAGGAVTRVVNVGKLVTPGVELSLLSNDLMISGLDVSGSVTYAGSRIKKNDGYVNAAGVLSNDTIGKYQPRVPVWRATALLNYRVNEQWNVAYGLRYSGKQYSTLDNSDPNGFAYQGASRYFTTDLRVRYQFAQQWSAALGIDNLNNYQYWNFHPYPQRSYTAELKWGL